MLEFTSYRALSKQITLVPSKLVLLQDQGKTDQILKDELLLRLKYKVYTFHELMKDSWHTNDLTKAVHTSILISRSFEYNRYVN